jgi:hypothetical protein
MAAKCEQCGIIFDSSDGKMVMLKDHIWLSIANQKDILCCDCIEKRLNRNIVIDDFKLGYCSNNKIPVNILYAQLNGLRY